MDIVIYFWELEINELDDNQLLTLMENRIYESGKNKINKKNNK